MADPSVEDTRRDLDHLTQQLAATIAELRGVNADLRREYLEGGPGDATADRGPDRRR